MAAIAARLPQVRVGPGDDPASEMGPLVTGDHRDRVVGYLDEPAPGAGPRCVVDGRKIAAQGPGFFLGPSLVDQVAAGNAGVRR